RPRRLHQAAPEYVHDYALPLRERGTVADPSVLDDGRRRMDDLRARFAAFDAGQDVLRFERRDRTDERNGRLVALAAAGVGGSALVLILRAIFLERAVLRPVRRVAIAARNIADGRRDVHVPDRGRGEVALLAGSFNAMADALSVREDELRVAGDRLRGILDH